MTLAELFAQERGAQSHLSAITGIKAPMLSQWASGTRPIPLERCTAIERATCGKVTVEELNTQVTWVRVPDEKWPHPNGRPLLDMASAESGAANDGEKAQA